MSSMKLITVAIAALFLLIVSAVLRFSELYVMSAALACVPIASYAVGRIVVRTLRCSREVPEYAREDEPIHIRLHIHGKTGLLGPMHIDDTLPEWLSKDADYRIQTDQPDDAITAIYTATASKRGEHTIGPLRMRVSDPLGFFTFNCEYPLTSSLVVLPSALHIPDLEIRRAGGFGEYQFEGSGARGSGTDFHGVREYQPGDELRRVHWASTARHGRLNVIEFEHRRAQDAVIAVDLRRGSEIGSGRFSSLEYAIRIAADIAEDALMSGSTARLVCAGVGGAAAESGTGLDQLYVILDSLARVRADRDEAISEVLLREIESFSNDSIIICVGASADAGLFMCAQLLAPKGTRLHAILVNVMGDSDDRLRSSVAELVAIGASASVVDCSGVKVEGHVSYEYAA